MLEWLRARRPGRPRPIPAEPRGLRGLPVFQDRPCGDGCRACVDACPTRALVREGGGVALDLGRCVFCSECADLCPEERVTFTSAARMASRTREGLVLGPGRELAPVRAAAALREAFGRSLRLVLVALGDCGGCTAELGACAEFDLRRWGIDWVAAPAQADALVVTGPVTASGLEALRRTWDRIAAPKFVIAVGACAISGGPHAASEAPPLLRELAPALYVPGCPPHPSTFVHGVLDLLGISPS